MRTAVRLAAGEGFALDAVTCEGDIGGWSPAEVNPEHRLVLVRRGGFRRLADGRAFDLDATLAFVGVPGQEERFAHPVGEGVSTAVHLSPDLWQSLAGDGDWFVQAPVFVDAPLDLAHRRFLRAAQAGDAAYELAEAMLTLVAQALRMPPPASGRSSTIVDAAREAIAADHPAARGLLSLAAHLAVSPHQLSRAFTAQLGVSLTHYRNRVRVARVLDYLESGERNLAGLAAELGFCDQSHLSRTVRRYLAHTPTALRGLLAP
jgi:AraC-like DNA-binding protein